MAIRLVRHDRINQTLFLSPQTDTTLLPGDVLVVESKQSLLGTTKVMNIGHSGNSLRSAVPANVETPGVQVAYLNVLDRPVIVKLRNEEARLDHIVQMLGQPIELAGSVRVLGPERAANPNQPATVSQRLADGTVLVFPRGAVHRNKLPATLPKPYDSEIAVGAFPSLIGGALGQSPELRSVGQLAPLLSAPGQDFAQAPGFSGQPVPLNEATPSIPTPRLSLPNETSGSSLSAAPGYRPPVTRSEALPVRPAVPTPRVEAQPTQNAVPEMPIVSSRPRVASLPFSGSAPMRSSSSSEIVEPEINDAPPPEENSKTSSRTNRLSNQGDSAPSLPSPQATLQTLSNPTEANAAPSTADAGATPFTVGQMLGILASVSALIGAALLARKHFDKPEQFDNASADFAKSMRSQMTPIEQALIDAESKWAKSDPAPNSISTPAASVSTTLAESVSSPARAEEVSRSVISESVVQSSELQTEQVANSMPVGASKVSQSSQASRTTLMSGMDDLDLLIKNGLPLREEAIHFPTGINLQGRIAPRPIYRVDRAAEKVLGSGPHFATSGSTSSNRFEREEVREQLESSDESLELDSHPAAEHRLSGPHFGRRRSGAQTATVGATASAAMPVAPASNQSTPLADALRQLQGDRPS
jgi:hypothetical protein